MKTNKTPFKELSLVGKYNDLRIRNLMTEEVESLFRQYEGDGFGFSLLVSELDNLNG